MNPITVFLTIVCRRQRGPSCDRLPPPRRRLRVLRDRYRLRFEDGEHLAEIRYPARW